MQAFTWLLPLGILGNQILENHVERLCPLFITFGLNIELKRGQKDGKQIGIAVNIVKAKFKCRLEN